MDILVSSAYFVGMFARVLSILAVLAIAVVTTVGAAHAARMDGIQADHAAHVGAMMQAPANAHPSCDDGQHCGSADAAVCEFICAGLSIFLTMPSVEAGDAFGPASHDLPPDANHVSWAPGLNERPPEVRLL